MSYTISSTSIEKCWAAFGQVSGPGASAWVYDPGGSISLISCPRSKTGIQLPDWKHKVAQGLNATTPFSAVASEYSTSPATENVFGTTVVGNPNGFRKAAAKWSHGISSIPADPPGSDMTQATNIAATKFYKALEQTMTAFQGGVFLAELRETLHMIRNPAKSLREGIRKAIDYLGSHRGRMMRRPKSARQKFLADTWLEFSFGWSPLLSDLNEAKNVLDRRQNQLLQELIPIVGVGTKESVTFGFNSFSNGIVNMLAEIRATYRSQKIYAGAVSSRAAGDTLLSMDALGMSPRSFVPVLWEAMPWSFMIDYFTNVGDVLSAWSNQTTKLAWGRETARTVSTYESTAVPKLPPLFVVQVYEYSMTSGKTTARKRTVQRNYISYVPVPALQFELPGFGRKWLNIAALADARRSLRFL